MLLTPLIPQTKENYIQMNGSAAAIDPATGDRFIWHGNPLDACNFFTAKQEGGTTRQVISRAFCNIAYSVKPRGFRSPEKSM